MKTDLSGKKAIAHRSVVATFELEEKLDKDLLKISKIKANFINLAFTKYWINSKKFLFEKTLLPTYSDCNRIEYIF